MQKLQLSIPEPCHENWQHMTPTQQGRYCNACAKEVVDFSMMTDTEVLNYFNTLSNEKICGRALPTQLDRTITRPKEPRKRLFWYWNYIVLFFMLFSRSNGAKAQGDAKAVTEFSPVKPADILTGDIVITSWVVQGKVTDRDGNPVPFATIKIKGKPTGLSADVNGSYSIRVNAGDVLIFSAAGVKETEITVGAQKIINIVLENRTTSGEVLVVVVAGQMMRRNSDEAIAVANSKYTAAIRVKEDRSDLPINKAKIIIAKKYSDHTDTVFTDNKGGYKLKGIKSNEHYFIKVEADGYSANEFTISGDDFKDKKKNWEVLLTKQKTELPVSKISKRENCPGVSVRLLGGINVINEHTEPIYVVDGMIDPGGKTINPDDIADVTILEESKAAALFGYQGSNGAIIITTRKTKVKDLKEVIVQSEFGIRRITHCSTSCLNVIDVSIANDSKGLTASEQNIKIFPNPVQRGNSFSISLKLKQTGNHQIQIADAAGRIILQKQINTVTKECKETLLADNRWSAGVYYIRAFDNKNQLISKSSFIVR